MRALVLVAARRYMHMLLYTLGLLSRTSEGMRRLSPPSSRGCLIPLVVIGYSLPYRRRASRRVTSTGAARVDHLAAYFREQSRRSTARSLLGSLYREMLAGPLHVYTQCGVTSASTAAIATLYRTMECLQVAVNDGFYSLRKRK